ncbi:spermatogenesis-associated protein 31-like [Phodopus roborovskii]|uniref:spermatogenesis-associated protein 31-like n=1 Tax=Phodopus roborovskii TaxID=109678 RepID=UPI0021E3D548|nr:spermatogenesis-associated protein 31-like [Phodopus roborovskii]
MYDHRCPWTKASNLLTQAVVSTYITRYRNRTRFTGGAATALNHGTVLPAYFCRLPRAASTEQINSFLSVRKAAVVSLRRNNQITDEWWQMDSKFLEFSPEASGQCGGHCPPSPPHGDQEAMEFLRSGSTWSCHTCALLSVHLFMRDCSEPELPFNFSFLLKEHFIQSVVRYQVPPYPTITQSPFPAYRGCRKKPKEDKVLISLLHRLPSLLAPCFLAAMISPVSHSILQRLVNTISFCRLLRQNASGEESNPEAAKAHLPPGQPTEESVATKPLVASSAPLQEHLMPQNSKILSPVLLDSSASTESQLSMSDSQAPETLTPGRHHSPPPPPGLPSLPSHPPDPVARPPCTPDASTMSPQCEGKAQWNSQSIPLPDLPSPTPTPLGLDQSHVPNSPIPGSNDCSRPTSTTPSLNNSCRPTSTNPGLEQQSWSISTNPDLEYSGRPTKTKSDLANSSRPTQTTQGFDQTSRPISSPSWFQVAAKAWCHSNSSYGDSMQDHLSFSHEEASFCTGPTSRQIEAGEPFFINPELELQNKKRAELEVNNGKEKFGHTLGPMESILESWISRHTTSQPFWSRNEKSEKFEGHQHSFCQKALGDHLPMKYSQLFWGLPFLHSESLVAAVYMPESLQDVPSILFNVLSTYIPIHSHSKVPTQMFSPEPLLHHSVKPKTLIQKLTSPQALVLPEIQTQARDPSSLPKPPSHSPLIMDYGTCTTSSTSQFTVPPAVQYLELHLLKKQQESRSELPAMVKKSQEACNPRTSNSWMAKGHESVVHLPGEFINPKLREQLEEHLKRSFIQHQGQWPQKVQLSLDLMKSQDKLARMSEAKVNRGPSSPSSLGNESIQHPSSVPSEGTEIFQSWRGPGKDVTKCLGRAERDHYWRPEGHRGKQEETYHMRSPRRDSQTVSPIDPGKRQLEETLKSYSSSKWRCTKESKLPVDIYQGVSVDHAVVPHDNSNTNMNTWKKSSMIDVTICNKTSEAFFLDANTQKVLETHLTRRLARHRWGLPLRGLKTIHMFNENKATPSPSNSSLSSWRSREMCTDIKASVLAEPFQKDPEKKVMENTSTVQSSSTPKPPPALQVQFLKEPPSCNNSGPSEATKKVLEDDLTSVSTHYSLVGRAWHRDKVLRPWTHNLEPIPGPVKGGYEPQKSKGVTFREMHEEVLVREFSVASQSTSIRETGHLEETEEEESSDWAYNTDTGEMTKSPINSDSLDTSESPSHSRPIAQGPEDSGLRTPHCLAPGVVLQDCATGTFLQDCAPEVLLAADILASRASQSCFKTMPPPSKSTSQDRNPFSCRENLTKISKPKEPWTSHIFGPNDKKNYGSPQQKVQLSGTRPVQSYGPDNHEKKVGDKIKNAIVSIWTTKDKGQGDLLQKVKAFSGTCQSRASGLNRFFRAQQVTEAQELMTPAKRVLAGKLGTRHVHASSQKNEHPNPPHTPVRRQVCCDRIPTAQPKTAQGNTGCVQANLKGHSPNKWMCYTNNQTQVSRASQYQHRAQTLLVPSRPIHCPRHCPCRSKNSGRASAFPYPKKRTLMTNFTLLGVAWTAQYTAYTAALGVDDINHVYLGHPWGSVADFPSL